MLFLLGGGETNDSLYCIGTITLSRNVIKTNVNTGSNTNTNAGVRKLLLQI